MYEPNRLRKILSRFAKKLNKGDVWNYYASFGLYQVIGKQDSDFDAILRSGLGEQAGLATTRSTTKHEVLSEVRQALEYLGDDRSHPNRKYLSADEFTDDVKEILRQVDLLCSSADVLAEIRLKDWHPFYPVFWDFAFIFLLEEQAVIFIGSSSD